jgi:lipopolysaccharide biosynthesis regulator YciM
MQGLGVVALQRGNLQDARLFLEASRLMEPENAKTHLYFGQVVGSLGETGQAVEAFEKVIDLSNDASLTKFAEEQLSALSTVESTETAR